MKMPMRMPADVAAKWMAALRSGEYKQAYGALSVGNGYCCLGVLQMVVSGLVERFDSGASDGAPSPCWLRDNNIQFFDVDTHTFAVSNNPSFYMHEIGRTSAAELNDSQDKTLAEIADILEPLIETF